ncbi:hypothetical protein PVMG_04521 [Plasmodium vivax Mauritania I]|uniref:VIR protein n=1 Tax=Plasmodium vivax Mauritania I TaxID=1035515 RepID=A0A0J9T3V5_PLAVI|nr:hypothetical protein PVMG_04521 [Plasmodium vivax Mauritania I]
MVYSTDNLPILVLCDKNETYKTSPTEKHKNVCKDLLKNLKILSNYSYIDRDTFFTGCKNLNNWLYFKEKELNVSSDIINKIFQAFNQIENVNYHFLECPYSTFDKEFNETEKLINLRIFNNNIETIQSLLKDRSKSKNCNLKKYVYECVHIYNIMKRTYGFPQDCTNNPHKNACDIINDFYKFYSLYIYNNNDILHKFPELSSNTNTNIIEGCPPEVIELDQASPSQSNESYRSIIQSVSPALGVMAGIPPFLALIYNVNINFT